MKTDGRGRKHMENSEADKSRKPRRVPIKMADRRLYGATYLLAEIGSTLSLSEFLKQCFPATYKSIQSIAYYRILEN